MQQNQRLSDILKDLPDAFSTENVTINDLKKALSGRSYGILLLVLAFPNLVPIPAPGLSAVLGAPLLLITFQLMLGLKTPWLPAFIGRRTIKRSYLEKICGRIIPYLKKLELVIVPRWKFLVGFPADRAIAFMCTVLSLMIMMPVPFGNAFPALAICILRWPLSSMTGCLSSLALW